MAKKPQDQEKILEGKLEKILAVGQRIHYDWRLVPRGGKGTPSRLFYGNYSTLLIVTQDGQKEQVCDAIVLPDSIGNQIEIYRVQESVRTGQGPMTQTVNLTSRLDAYDKTIDRWYRPELI